MQTATISAQKPLPASWRGIHFRGTAAGQWTEASLAGISTLDPPDLIQYKHGSVSGTTKTQPALSGSLRKIRSKAPPQEPRRDLENSGPPPFLSAYKSHREPRSHGSTGQVA